MVNGFELMALGTRGRPKRKLIVDLETSALNPEMVDIICYRAVNRWDENHEFDEWAKASVALSAEVESILGVTNEQLAHCRAADAVMADFLAFTGLSEVR